MAIAFGGPAIGVLAWSSVALRGDDVARHFVAHEP
jgi:hypothetical protein